MLVSLFLMYILNELHPLPKWIIVVIWAINILDVVFTFHRHFKKQNSEKEANVSDFNSY